jgi:hypothetical protein
LETPAARASVIAAVQYISLRPHIIALRRLLEHLGVELSPSHIRFHRKSSAVGRNRNDLATAQSSITAQTSSEREGVGPGGRLDRLGRNVDDLRRIVAELTGKGVVGMFVKNGLTFTGDKRGPMAILMLTMLGAVAVRAGTDPRAPTRGDCHREGEGRLQGTRQALTPDEAKELVTLAGDGMAKAELARVYGISRQTVYQYLRGGVNAAE